MLLKPSKNIKNFETNSSIYHNGMSNECKFCQELHITFIDISLSPLINSFYKDSAFFRVSLTTLMRFLVSALYYAYRMPKTVESAVTVRT